MPKTGLKTFVYSFSVSLLTIFTVNGVYWHETNSSQADLTIPSQNITLFLNSHADNPSTRPVPVKKIALTVLPAVSHPDGSSAIPPAEPEIIMADTTDALEIPLEFGDFSVQKEENQSRPLKIAANFEQLIHNPPPAAAFPALPQAKPEAGELSGTARQRTGDTGNLTPEGTTKKLEPRADTMETKADLQISGTTANISDKSKKETAKTAVAQRKAAGQPDTVSDKKEQPEPGARPPALSPARPADTILTAEAEIPLTHVSQTLQAVSPLQDSTEKLPEPRPARQAAPVLMAEADTDSGSIIPLQRVRDVWAGRNENIKITDHGSPNQVALADGNVPIKSMTSDSSTPREDIPQASPDEEEWEKMAEKVNSDSPWTVAKSAGKSRNNMLQNETYYQADSRQIHDALAAPSPKGDEVKVASETVKNLLIPIPEDILNDENLTPQLVSSKKPDDIRKEIEVEEKLKETVRTDPLFPAKKDGAKVKTAEADGSGSSSSENDGQSPLEEKDKKKNILNSLSSIFSSSTNVKEKSAKSREEGIFDNLRRKIAGRNKVKIMPTEMRLSFQPNRAEISGQTLRWIQAFAARAAEEDGMMIEIRIDGTSAMELQQKRLNLLHNILTNKGVEYSKINTVFTQREPNSFIIRTVRLNNTNTGGGSGNINRATQGYYLQW